MTRDLTDGLPPTISSSLLKDVIAWIQDNYQRYHYPHMLALVLATASNANDARKALQILDSNYFGQNVVREAKQVRL